MKNHKRNNFGLVFERHVAHKNQPVGIYIAKNIIDCHLTGGQSYLGYLYTTDGGNEKISNLNRAIVTEIEKTVGETMPENIFDYIYAVLHSPTYRETYKEFLKIDFPRVPYPKDTASFKLLVALGGELRELHLMESPKVRTFITTFPESGSNMVEQKYPKYDNGKVFINKTQYFGGVPETSWTFYIGGYQPAQKWLKDRRGRKLTNQDIEHYQKMIVALAETGRIMREIDSIHD